MVRFHGENIVTLYVLSLADLHWHSHSADNTSDAVESSWSCMVFGLDASVHAVNGGFWAICHFNNTGTVVSDTRKEADQYVLDEMNQHRELLFERASNIVRDLSRIP